MTIDIPVYDAMRFDIRAGDLVWAEKVGTPDAILRDGFLIGGELRYCSRELFDERGYTFDAERAQKALVGKNGPKVGSFKNYA
jgi:hypothetical protein